MPIPNNINEEHIIQALTYIDENGVPERNESTRYDLFYKNRLYPPKYVISVANKFAHGSLLPLDQFSGGKEANSYLKQRGFIIIPKKSHSWTIYSATVFVKEIDKSALINHGTALPMELRPIFNLNDITIKQRIDITLRFNDKTYGAYFKIEKKPNPRTQLIWHSDFEKILQEQLPQYYEIASKKDKLPSPSPQLRFEAIDNDKRHFNIKIIMHPEVKPLELYEDYSRNEVHDIFDPLTPFYPQTGTWGLQGIVHIPNRPNDFVFLITYGQEQSGHVFDEGITEDGILTWQSQPSQDLETAQIKKFIIHDHFLNNIYLFLRSNGDNPYTYLGRLAYVSHDSERTKPVWFKWQILDWDLSGEQAAAIGIELKPVDKVTKVEIEPGTLTLSDPPKSVSNRTGTKTSSFRGRHTDFAQVEAVNKALGLEGEKLVLDYEIKRLTENGRPDLSKDIIHTSKVEGDGAGYDIQSFELDNSPRFIEVKTTTGNDTTPFMMSSNERYFAETHKDCFYLYRIFNFERTTKSAEVFITSGEKLDSFEYSPIQFRVYPR